MNNPEISIITICYNAADTISATMQSVLNQDYTNFEYILVDGASKDSTVEIIKSFKDDRIRYISEKDEGLYDAINKGIQLSTGKYISLLHADDKYASKHVLKDIINQFNSHPNIDAISSSINIYKTTNINKPYRVYKSTNFKKWQFRIGMQVPHPGFFVKRTAFEKVGYYRIQYKISGDFEWLLRATLLYKLNILYTDYISVHMLDGGLSSSGWKSKTLLNNEILKILKSHKIYSNRLLVYSKYFFKFFQLRF